MSGDDRMRVGAADAFDDGDCELVDVDGTQVGVLLVDGTFYALENECRHAGGPVCTGTVRPRLEAEYAGPGERVTEDYVGDPTVTCPWHGWEYDLETGVHIGDASYQLRTYAVTVEGDDVYVSTGEE